MPLDNRVGIELNRGAAGWHGVGRRLQGPRRGGGVADYGKGKHVSGRVADNEIPTDIGSRWLSPIPSKPSLQKLAKNWKDGMPPHPQLLVWLCAGGAFFRLIPPAGGGRLA